MSGITGNSSLPIHSSPAGYYSISSEQHSSDSFHHFQPDHDQDRLQHPATSTLHDDMGRRSGTVEVPATQRMLAACSGSLLTSLIVTPLDVVRVRLQSQSHPPPASPNTSTTSALSRFHRLPSQPFSLPTAAHISRPISDLGVTSCCREVFWVSSTNELCLAYPAIGSTVPGSSSLSKPSVPAGASAEGAASCLIETTASHRFTGTWEGLVKIARNEGLPSLYRGLSPTLLMSIPANVIYFTGYESLRYSPRSPLSQLSDNMAPLIAGSLARTIAATVIAPMELFKTRLQAASHPKPGSIPTATAENSVSAFKQTIASVQSMVAQQGVTSLWRGLMLTLWRDVPFSGIYWWGYETVRGFLAEERYGRTHHLGPIERHRVLDNDELAKEEDKATFVDSFISGATSGAVAAFVTTPFDVGKTRRQVWRAASDGAGEAGAAATMSSEGSMPKVLAEIYGQEGVRGLFRGCIPRMLKVAPACAIMISSYEIGKKAAMRMKEQKEGKENL